jgi:hypothetical protein
VARKHWRKNCREKKNIKGWGKKLLRKDTIKGKAGKEF